MKLTEKFPSTNNHIILQWLYGVKIWVFAVACFMASKAPIFRLLEWALNLASDIFQRMGNSFIIQSAMFIFHFIRDRPKYLMVMTLTPDWFLLFLNYKLQSLMGRRLLLWMEMTFYKSFPFFDLCSGHHCGTKINSFFIS